jgi:tripartite-type tricarboxylate transporter receptor subunit TctC
MDNKVRIASLLAATQLGVMGSVCAQDRPAGYPNKPIRIVSSVQPGAGGDTMARIVAQIISDKWGTNVVVDNRAGAGGTIASELVARAAPDGYTLYSQGDSLLIQGATKRVAFDVLKAFEPVTPTSQQPYILITQINFPVKSIKELAAYSQSNRVTYSGSSGIGSMPHIGMERFAKLAGAKFTFVAYKGSGPGIIAVIGGEIHMVAASSIGASMALRTGKVRALANLGPKRIPSMPDLPTVAEQGFPGFKVTNRYGLQAPAGTPKEIVLALNRVVGEGMYDPKLKARLAADGSEPADRMTPSEYKASQAKEYVEIEQQVRQMDLGAILK